MKQNILRIVFLFLLMGSATAEAQEVYIDELNVEIAIPRLGIREIPVAIQGQDAYLPVQDLFKMLKIKSTVNKDRVEGFFIHPDSTYAIDYGTRQIHYRGETSPLPESGFITTPVGNYLRTDFFGKIFGIHADFSFRSLSVAVETEKELPVFKEMRRKKMRESLKVVKGVIVADSVIPYSYPLFKPGVLDWGIYSTQQSEIRKDNRLTLGLGTMFLGGETNLLMNYSTEMPFQSRNQFYQWRRVNNKSKYIKQLTVGRIFAGATSSLYAPVSGVEISNSPLQNRRSFGSYTISDYTDPRWTVELYVNNVLVDFTTADASGFYTFEVPLMYGSTKVDLRFYGPYGQERVEERMINIPFNFVPKKELEYTFSAGIVENAERDRFSRFEAHYGLNNYVTFGAGAEYLSNTGSGEVMPFVNSSVRLTSNTLFSAMYMHGVKGEALLDYQGPSNLQLNLQYTKYDPEQTVINYNYLEERKISLSVPIRTEFFSMYGRLSLDQIVMPTTEFTTAQLLLSGMLFGVSTNFTTYGIYNDRVGEPTIYSGVSQTYRLPYRFLFSPQIQYNFSNNSLNNLVLELERQVFNRGFLNVSFENNFIRNTNIFELGLRYRFNFAQAGITSRFGNEYSSFIESASGSLLWDDNTNIMMAKNHTSRGRAAITLIPFLDLNRNGKKDPMERAVPDLAIRNKKGRVQYNEDRTVLWITELQPYQDILLRIDPVSLDNIAWKIKNTDLSIYTLPNHFQKILVPIHVLGEAAGMVYLQEGDQLRGQGRITVQILDEAGNIVKEVLSEGDGYFAHLGLAPGEYKAVIDPAQLEKLGYNSKPEEIPFEIEVSEWGDIKDTLDFTLIPEISEAPEAERSPAKEEEEKEAPDQERLVVIDLGKRGYYAFSDTDENIELIQKYLKELGFNSGKIDGIYGKNTLRAVRNFQEEMNVRVDGIFGPITLKALQKRMKNL